MQREDLSWFVSQLQAECFDEPMTARDRFAMAALTGMLSSGEGLVAISEQDKKEGVGPTSFTAKVCFEFADAMLKARSDQDKSE